MAEASDEATALALEARWLLETECARALTRVRTLLDALAAALV